MIKRRVFKQLNNSAFSLVEMLMALLVASLLMAALAPVMTKRFNENVVVSGTGKQTSEHFKIFDDVSKNGTEENTFTIPSNAVNVRVTMIGGGGAGGGATFGSKIITATERDWKIPDGVKKIRVYMVGAGGGGASGGIVLANQTGTLNAGWYEYKDENPASKTPAQTGGEFRNQKISDLITTKTQSKYHPAIDSKCSASGYNSWEPNISSLAVSVTGCGAGGAGGENAGGGGGSGGYKTQNITLPDNYIIRMPGIATTGSRYNALAAGFSSGAGGSGGEYPGTNNCAHEGFTMVRTSAPGGTYGGAGGIGVATYAGCNAGKVATAGSNGGGTLGSYGGGSFGDSKAGGRGGYYGGGGGGGGSRCDGGGGGGGGPAIVMNSSNSVLFIASGGGAGGTGGHCSNQGAGSGGGGGPEAGGGGGGGGYTGAGSGGGSGTSGGAAGAKSGSCTSGSCYCGTGPCNAYGGGGGGAKYGVSGTSTTAIEKSISMVYGRGGILPTNIFGSDYCNGGNAGQNGKPGAIRISWSATSNALKCKYNTYSNGSSGGGAGQVWIGEIDVTPGQYLNFFIGQGGNRQTANSSNGNNGGDTYILNQAGAVLATVQGGGGGIYSSSSNISTSVGLGKGKKTSNWYDWTKQNTNTSGGQNGLPGKTTTEGSSGGKGGGIYLMDGSFSDGGNPGNAENNGYDATVPGTGGGGGGGVTTYGHFPGNGGRGADGYIYIEWGDSNGGGGSSGEIIEEKIIVSAVANTKLEITIGEGGKAANIEHDSLTKYKPGAKGGNGEDTLIKIGTRTYKAKGGIGGDEGGLTKGEHGKGGKLEDLTESSAKSYEGNPGMDGFGGIGANSIYKSQASGDGIGGCGGSMISGKCFSPSETPYGKDASPAGAGGGGGSIQNSTPYKGGNGSNGLVLIQWEEFYVNEGG